MAGGSLGSRRPWRPRAPPLRTAKEVHGMAAIPVLTGTRRAGRSALRRREERAGWLFVLPWVLGLVIFIAYPVIATFYLSLADYNIIQPPRWIGLQNYATMFTSDPDFWTAVGNSAYYAVISVVLGLVGSLLLALVMNIPTRGIGIYRTLYYLPGLVPPVVGTIVFMLMLDP